MADEPLLSVRDLTVAFGAVEVVRGLSFDVYGDDVLAIVGESGAGKSLTARALLGLEPRGATVGGTVRMRTATGTTGVREEAARLWGRRVALVPQDALSALSPVHPVEDQLAAAVRSLRRVSRRDARARAARALERVGVPAARGRAYPHELSGGMRQRAVIAMATVGEPELVVADEPTTALDRDLREQVLRVLTERREATGAALVLVTHDLEAVREHAGRVLVMYAGRHVESGPADRVLGRPRAPYTAGLLAALTPVARGGRLPAVPGVPPAPGALPPGCAFAPRCPLAEERCRTRSPEPLRVDAVRSVSCHRWDAVPASAAGLFPGRA
ncbi:ABC transporter ATP-binding protein [Streptomyces lavendofoliae]|uniref:ABC transporter ATP-binding protein n=1 Tax=Streptomyces lavendofoliae TaxID=67314 RepID=A0A918M382_9ACTN|nr:ABC transporter ATP-binding protein [Streptomyces lavendofoliae]GGU28704.1 ABC transporter ATP-binding protein [Streptomyces lavendofoliae]